MIGDFNMEIRKLGRNLPQSRDALENKFSGGRSGSRLIILGMTYPQLSFSPISALQRLCARFSSIL
jgi:hypothetical protein